MTAPPLTRRLVIAQFVTAAVLGIAVFVGRPGQWVHDLLPKAAFLLGGLLTVWSLFEASRDVAIDVSLRRAWRELLWAIAVLWVGDVLWTVLALRAADRPAISIADLTCLAFYPLALRAFVRFASLGWTTSWRRRVQMDALMAATMVGSLFYWYASIRATPDTARFWLLDAVNLAYPLGDAMLFAGVVVLWWRHSDARSIAIIRLIAAAIAAKMGADLLYLRSVITDEPVVTRLVDGGSIAFYGLVTLAAMKARDLREIPPVPTTRPRRMVWLPFACVVSVSVLFIDLIQRGQFLTARGMAIGLLALLVLVLVRQDVVNNEISRFDAVAIGHRAERRLAALVNHASDIIMILDANATIRFVSPSVVRILGLVPSQLEGTSCLGLVHGDDTDDTEVTLGRLLQHPGAQETFVCRVQHGNGGWRWVEAVCTNHVGTDSINGVVVNLRDVTERRELEGRLEWQALHDPMTGLANRVLFSDRVSHALERRLRVPVEIGVLFIDLDHFKVVNDTLGHAAGDALLREAARRIQGSVRAADTVARLGGDEFAVLLDDASPRECHDTAERLLQQLRRPFRIDGREVFSGASVGAAMAAPEAVFDDLVRDADVAMYVAKGEGRGRVVLFEAAMRDQVTERAYLEAELRRALERHELQVHYQPQFDLRTGEMLGAEALARWTHPSRGMIPPSRFVPIAEQAGLMVALSRFILNAACLDAMSWRRPDGSAADLHVSVNLSGRHLQDPRVVLDVANALQESGLNPTLLTVEITEGVMMHNTEAASAVLRELKALGVTIAIDDFGTGYSSLSYLQQFPIDILKIDKAFVDKLGTADSDAALARAILALGDALGLATLAEGIETLPQVEILQQMGCLLGQGYLFSRPVAARSFAAMVSSGSFARVAIDAVGLVPSSARVA